MANSPCTDVRLTQSTSFDPVGAGIEATFAAITNAFRLPAVGPEDVKSQLGLMPTCVVGVGTK